MTEHMKHYKQIATEMQNEERAVELQGLVREFFEKYLNRVEESDSGKEFHPITVNCCRAMMTKPLNDLLDRMASLSGAARRK
jgi:3'-phosphoadenosine 5'-phosphosulfate sulfotransferase (PAPS reductase)/FAD synthetase